jgi:hypothetical protein
MADPTLTSRFLILLGDGASPETFASPCGANARSVRLINNLGSEALLDCDSPLDQVAAIRRWLESQDTEISISGRVSLESWADWRAWADNGAEKNIRVLVDEASADGGGYWSLEAFLGQLELGTEGKSTMTFTATISGSGRRVWTAAA